MKIEYKLVKLKDEDSLLLPDERLALVQKQAKDGWEYVREDEDVYGMTELLCVLFKRRS